MDQADQRVVLEGFSRALDKEAHNLTHRPGLVWQQMYNRLQWADGPSDQGVVRRALDGELRHRSGPDAPPWLHQLNRTAESTSLLRTLTDHRGRRSQPWSAADFLPGVNAAAFSPDGASIVSGGSDEAVRIWNARTGQEAAALMGHEGKVNAVAFSPDGSQVVSGSDDGTLRTWGVAARVGLLVLTAHESGATCCAFSPDGSRIVAGGRDGVLRIWEAGTGEQVATLSSSPGWTILSCAVSPDGRFVATGSEDYALRVWDLDTASEVRSWGLGSVAGVRSCAFSPDGRTIASGRGLREVESGTEIADFGRAGVDCCAFSPDGTMVVTDAAHPVEWNRIPSESRRRVGERPPGKLLKAWDAETGEELWTRTGHTGQITSCTFSPDGRTILSTSEDGTLKLWDAGTGETAQPATGHEGPVECCAYSPDGRSVVSGGRDETLKLWDAATGTLLRTLAGHTDVVNGCAFSPDGERIVSASSDATLRIWDAGTGETAGELSGHLGPVLCCTFSSDGRVVASGGWDGTLRLWDLESGRETASLTDPRLEARTFQTTEGAKPVDRRIEGAHTESVEACVFTPDGEVLVSGGREGTVKLWRLTKAGWRRRPGAVLEQVLAGDRAVQALSVSSDGSRIFAAATDRTVTVWETRTGARVAVHDLAATSLALTQEDAWVVGGGVGDTLRFWDPWTGAEALRYLTLAAVRCAAASPTAAQVCCGDSGGSLDVLEVVGSRARVPVP